MINQLSLLFSLAAVVFLAIRAAALDRMLPWFKPAPKEDISMRQKRKLWSPPPPRPR